MFFQKTNEELQQLISESEDSSEITELEGVLAENASAIQTKVARVKLLKEALSSWEIPEPVEQSIPVTEDGGFEL